MRSDIFVIAGIAAAASLLSTFILAPAVRANEGAVTYPDGYRTWTFLHSSLVPAGFPGFSKSPCVKPCTNGIFYFYGNEPAMKGLRTGTYADGAVIAEEMLEFRVGDKGNGGEGHRVLTAVMVKDSRRYAATGGWGFGNFDEGSKANTLDAKAQQACFQCHISRKDHGYVFTEYVER
jgi:Cytochrome P460